jgi:hypothetical protein
MSTVLPPETASDMELIRYEKAYRETRRTLDEAIETLAILEEFEETTALREQIALNRFTLETKRSDMVRANIAFHSGRATMRPPSAELVGKIVAIAKQAVDLTVEKATMAAMLNLTTSALNKFAQIQAI